MPSCSANLEARNSVIGQLVARLAAGNYEELIRYAPQSRVTAQEIEAAVKQYGRRFLPLPLSAYKLIDYVAVHNASPAEWSVVVPLFTEEEGHSDLSLELSMVEVTPEEYEVQVDDIHVL
jgi:hypothetical protein